MAESAINSTDNVSVGKGVAGGYFYVAPAGTKLPTDNSTKLAAAFSVMGFLGEDGINFSDSSSTDSHYDMNGDTIATTSGSIEKTFTVVLQEVMRRSLALQYGEANVTDTNGVIKVVDNGPTDDEHVGVFELLLKNGRKWRRIVPKMKLNELGDLTVNSTTLVGRELTLGALKSADGYYIDYIDSTETTQG